MVGNSQLIKKNTYYIVYEDGILIMNDRAENDLVLETKKEVFVTNDEVEYNDKLNTLIRKEENYE